MQSSDNFNIEDKYVSSDENETIPILQKINLSPIHKQISKSSSNYYSDSEYSDNDEHSVYPQIIMKEMQQRFEDLDKYNQQKRGYQTFNQSISPNNLSTSSNAPDMDNFDKAEILAELMEEEKLTEVDINETQDNKIDKENKIHKDNIDSKKAQLIAQFHDIMYPVNEYTVNLLFSGIKTEHMMDKGLTYNDVNLLPNGYINFTKSGIDMKTKFSRNIELSLPLVSSPMDTVTEDKMAIKMALMGGIGIIHCNNSPAVQANMVKNVKRFKNGLVMDPITFRPMDTIQTVLNTKRDKGYSFTSFPITHNGESNGSLVGLLTKRDIPVAEAICQRENKTLEQIFVKDVMRPVSELAFIKNGITDINEIKKTMLDFRITKLPIINNHKLMALACHTDVINMENYPNASIRKDTKQLLVGAAVSTETGFEYRVKLLAEAGVDAIVIDSSQGCSEHQIDVLLHIKEYYPNIDVVCGNIATKFQTKLLMLAGADALRVGMGSGSISTIQNVTGTGRAQLSGIVECVVQVGILSKIPFYGECIPIIADGGIRTSGDITKALAAGASSVMLGSLIAGTNETPGIIEDRPGGIKVKKYRGMGSFAAMSNGYVDMYTTNNLVVPQCVSGEVVAKGPLQNHLELLMDGVKSGLLNAGIQSIKDIPKMNSSGRICWEQKTYAAILEGHIHSLHHYNY